MRDALPAGIGLALCLLGCAPSATETEPVHRPATAADLYPLAQGNAWSYDVDTEQESSTLAVIRVQSFDGHEALVQTGRDTVRYLLQPEGIYLPDEGVWLLQAPLRDGQHWPSRSGRTARIERTGQDVETASGTFSGCLCVHEAGGEGGQEIRTTYCPGVGPVLVESRMPLSTSGRPVTVRASLRGYQVLPSRPARR